MVTDISSSFGVLGGSLFFASDTGAPSGEELWKSDGTAAGTGLFLDIYPGGLGSEPGSFTTVGSTLFFVAKAPTYGRELWKTDGTVAGTSLTKDLSPGLTFDTFSLLTRFGSKLLFANGNKSLCVSDGTAVGTGVVKNFTALNGITATMTSILVDGATAYFAADNGTVGHEPYRTDGTSLGTVLIRDIRPPAPNSSTPASFLPLGNKLLFTTSNATVSGIPWVSDGTAAGTLALLPTHSEVDSMVPGLGKAWFYAYDGGILGAEPYATDGTPAGTYMIKDVNPGFGDSRTSHLTEYAGKMYFTAVTSTTGRELWVSDGTGPGTNLFFEFNPGAAHGIPDVASLQALNVVNGSKEQTKASMPPPGARCSAPNDVHSGVASLMPAIVISPSPWLAMSRAYS